MTKSLIVLTACLLLWVTPLTAQTIRPYTESSTADSPELARALITGDSAVCANGSMLSVMSVTRNPGGTGTTTLGVLKTAVTGDCRWLAEGLSAGSYRIEISGTDGVLGGAAFDATLGTTVRVHVAPSTVMVTGRVMARGLPVPDASLSFSPYVTSRRVKTDQNGAFHLLLPEAGEYQVLLSGDSVYTQFKQAKFSVGSNTWDWVLPDGVVQVQLTAIDAVQNQPIGLQILDLKNGAAQSRRLEGNRNAIEIKGVPFGTYQLFAGSGSAEPDLERPKTTGVVFSLTSAVPSQSIVIPVVTSSASAVP